MTNANLLNEWKKTENCFDLIGWDFSAISDKWDYPNEPWDYRLTVKSYLKDTDTLLDMGTGGGEVLLTIGHPYENTYATEAYLPNLELCKSRLSPLGITIAQTFTDDKLPFEADSFDFITNRHESFDLEEVARVLKRGGYFFTQQVMNRNFHELVELLNGRVIGDYPGHSLENYANILSELGFEIIIKDEAKLPVKIYDIDAVIFYAKACVWEVPDFSVETHFERLLLIKQKIDNDGCFHTTGGRFLLAARKL